jgi:membrane protease YdiL (CAAX protease family)
MGWRGYAMPLFQQRMSPIASAVALGVLWAVWHLPREVPTLLGGGPLSGWLAGQGVFVLLCVSISIVIAYFVNRTGGSVLPAIIVHGGTNVWTKAAARQAYAMFHIDTRVWIVVALAVLIVAVAGRNLGHVPSESSAA